MLQYEHWNFNHHSHRFRFSIVNTKYNHKTFILRSKQITITKIFEFLKVDAYTSKLKIIFRSKSEYLLQKIKNAHYQSFVFTLTKNKFYYFTLKQCKWKIEIAMIRNPFHCRRKKPYATAGNIWTFNIYLR